MKQVMFYDKENEMIHGGLLMDNGDIICGCCGGIIPADEIGGEDNDHEIIKVYDFWVNLDETICGDGLYSDFPKGARENCEDNINDPKTLAKDIESAVEWLREDEERECVTLKLDKTLAVCIGWSNGYDSEDELVVHGKPAPHSIVAGLKLWISNDTRTNIDYIDAPRYEDGSAYDAVWSISPDDDYEQIASYFLKEFDTLKKLGIDENGLIRGDDDAKNILREKTHRYEVVEVCPDCGAENIMRWNVEKEGYIAYCPRCGSKMMLCDECLHSDDAPICDWCDGRGCCRERQNNQSWRVQ